MNGCLATGAILGMVRWLLTNNQRPGRYVTDAVGRLRWKSE